MKQAGWAERGPAARERVVRALETDPTLEAEVRSLRPALTFRLTAGVQARIGPVACPVRARRAFPLLGASALAACALMGVWVGWSADRAAPAPTLLAAVQITPFTDPSQ